MEPQEMNAADLNKLPRTSGLRRAFTTRNNTVRQVSINLPSRQITGNTLRLRRSNSEHNALLHEVQEANMDQTEQHAKIIVMELEQNQHLMEDNPAAEELRREALRDLAQGLTLKRHVRAKLSVSVSLRSKQKPLSFWKRCKYQLGFTWKRMKERIHNFVFSVELWYEEIRKIEGNFGSAVGSFFYFLRWLFVFNLMLLVLIVGFIVVPQVLYNNKKELQGIEVDRILDLISGDGSSVVRTSFIITHINESHHLIIKSNHSTTHTPSLDVTTLQPPSTTTTSSPSPNLLRTSFINESYHPTNHSAARLHSIAIPPKPPLLPPRTTLEPNTFTNQSLHPSNHSTARPPPIAVTTPLQPLITSGGMRDSLLFYGHYHSGNIEMTLNYNMSFAYFFTMLCLYLLFFFVLCFKTASSYRHNFIETAGGVLHVYSNKVFSGWDFGIATEQAAALNARSICNEFKELLAEQDKNVEAISMYTKIGRYLKNVTLTAIVLAFIAGLEYGIWLLLSVEEPDFAYWGLILSLIITAAVCICPLLFDLIVRFESYAPRTALYVTLARTFLLDTSTLTLLLFFWAKSNKDCWETSFGQETYRLVILDAFISLILLPFFEFVRAMIYKIYPVGIAPEFNIAYNSLTLIYNEIVLGFGMLFSPLLVVAVTIKFLLLFYIKKEVAIRACVPARKVWRAAQTQTVMYMLVSLSIFVAMFVIGTVFFSMPSQVCGPFVGYSHVFAVLTEGVLSLSTNTTLATILQFITRPGVIGFLMMFLCVFVYYMRARSLAQVSMVNILREMLVLEAKDKDFLLSAISKVSNGEWLYNQREQSMSDNSHTWKFVHEGNGRKPSNFGFSFDGSRLNHSVFESRPKSYVKDRPKSKYRDGNQNNDGDTDSSFSWQGSSNRLNELGV